MGRRRDIEQIRNCSSQWVEVFGDDTPYDGFFIVEVFVTIPNVTQSLLAPERGDPLPTSPRCAHCAHPDIT